MPPHPGSPATDPLAGLPPVPAPKRRWVLQLPYATPPLTMNTVLGKHWAKSRAAIANLHEAAFFLARHHAIPRLERVTVELVCWPGTNRVQDADGLAATLKPLLDGLRMAGVVDDDRGHVVVSAALRVVERRDDPTDSPRSRLVLIVCEV